MPGNHFARAARSTAHCSGARGPPGAEAGGAGAIYTAVRHLAAVERIVERLAARPPAPSVAALLAVALAQLQRDSYAPHTVVDQAVRAVQQSGQASAASGFVNAVLRNFLRQREALLAELQSDASVRYNLPRGGSNVCAASIRMTGVDRRVAATAAAARAARQRQAHLRSRLTWRGLAQLGIDATRVGAHAVWLHQPRPVADDSRLLATATCRSRTPGRSSPRLARREARHARARCVCCAGRQDRASGANSAPPTVTAVEVDAERAQRIADNLRRGRLSARVLRG